MEWASPVFHFRENYTYNYFFWVIIYLLLKIKYIIDKGSTINNLSKNKGIIICFHIQ